MKTEVEAVQCRQVHNRGAKQSVKDVAYFINLQVGFGTCLKELNAKLVS